MPQVTCLPAEQGTHSVSKPTLQQPTPPSTQRTMRLLTGTEGNRSKYLFSDGSTFHVACLGVLWSVSNGEKWNSQACEEASQFGGGDIVVWGMLSAAQVGSVLYLNGKLSSKVKVKQFHQNSHPEGGQCPLLCFLLEPD